MHDVIHDVILISHVQSKQYLGGSWFCQDEVVKGIEGVLDKTNDVSGVLRVHDNAAAGHLP